MPMTSVCCTCRATLALTAEQAAVMSRNTLYSSEGPATCAVTPAMLDHYMCGAHLIKAGQNVDRAGFRVMLPRLWVRCTMRCTGPNLSPDSCSLVNPTYEPSA